MPTLAPLLPLLLAAPPPTDHGTIVVTGRALPAALGEEVYATVEIGRDRLDGSASNRLEEVLRDVPGFQLFRRSDARSANPTSQGATLRALGGNASSRALLILDGVPQTDPFGGWVSWPAYDPRRLGRARVVRGGGSGANGPGALAGTIELESAGPAELGGLTASAAYGSRDGIDLQAGAGIAAGPGFLAVSGAWLRGDGFVPVVAEQRGPADRPSPYSQASVALRGIVPVAAGTELQAGALLFTDARERGTALSEIETQGADASLRLVGRGWSALGYVQGRNFYNSFAALDPARTTATRTAEQYAVPSTGLGARIEARPRIGAAELRLGADWRETQGRTQERYQFVAGEATRHRRAGGRTRHVGAFAELGHEAGPLTLHAGARIDRWRISGGFLEETVFATGEPLTALSFPDRSGWQPTGRAGIAWRPAEALTLRGAGYLGWRLPTLNELYRPFRVGADATAANAALAPERLQGIEAGADWRPLPAARIGVTLFAGRIEDAIANVTLARGPGTFPGVGFVSAAGEYRQRRNLDAIETRGIELDASLALGRWSLAAGYSYADARVRASGAAVPLDRLRPAQTPRHGASAGLAWSGGAGAAASLSMRYQGAQFEDDLNRQPIPSALSFDAAAALPLGRRLAIEARAENLTDERIVAGITAAGIVERATPRTFWLGLRWRD